MASEQISNSAWLGPPWMRGCAEASPWMPIGVTRASGIGRLGTPPGETLIWRMAPVIFGALRACKSVSPRRELWLQQSEVHFNRNLNWNRHALFQRRFEDPLFDAFDGFLIQTQPKRAHNPDVPRSAIFIHDNGKNVSSLALGDAGILGVLGFQLVAETGRGDAIADFQWCDSGRFLVLWEAKGFCSCEEGRGFGLAFGSLKQDAIDIQHARGHQTTTRKSGAHDPMDRLFEQRFEFGPQVVWRFDQAAFDDHPEQAQGFQVLGRLGFNMVPNLIPQCERLAQVTFGFGEFLVVNVLLGLLEPALTWFR